jgi:hypothetical protein
MKIGSFYISAALSGASLAALVGSGTPGLVAVETMIR